MNDEKRGLSRAFLKNLSMITMFIDHFGAVFGWDMDTDLYLLLRKIGRIAMPIYAFFIAEGLIHTRDRTRYAARLAILAIISTPCCNFKAFRPLLSMESPNILYAFFIAVLAISAIDRILDASKNPSRKDKALIVGIALSALIVSELMSLDYGLTAIVLIMVMYYGKKAGLSGKVMLVLETLVMSVVYFLHRLIVSCLIASTELSAALGPAFDATALEMYCIISLVLLMFYDGRKGKPLPAKVYYIFYPAHILLLGFAVRAYCGYYW